MTETVSITPAEQPAGCAGRPRQKDDQPPMNKLLASITTTLAVSRNGHFASLVPIFTAADELTDAEREALRTSATNPVDLRVFLTDILTVARNVHTALVQPAALPSAEHVN